MKTGFMNGNRVRMAQGQDQGSPIQISPEQLQQLIQSGAVPADGSVGSPQYNVAQNASQPISDLVRNGAIVEVQISAPQGGGAPQTVHLMIDTGASITGIRDSVASAAGLVATDSVQVGGVAGTQTSAIYGAKLAIPKYNINFDAVQIAGFQLPGQQDIDGLLGRDLLQKMLLTYSGLDGTFNLASTPGEGGTSVDLLSMIAMGVLSVGAFGSAVYLSLKK